MITCHFCPETFPDYHALALHITTSKTGHHKGKKWAASFLLKARTLNNRRPMPERSPMTDEQKGQLRENKTEAHRELPGEIRTVQTVCPKCKRTSQQILPREYAESKTAWRSNNMIVILCPSCAGRR